MASSAFDLLHRYSEWLDSQKLMKGYEESGGDTRTHDDLVREFLKNDEGDKN